MSDRWSWYAFHLCFRCGHEIGKKVNYQYNQERYCYKCGENSPPIEQVSTFNRPKN